MIVFLDTEFTDLFHPELLSLGLVTLDGREHYGELDLSTKTGKARRRAATDFVLFGGVLDQWGRVSGAASTEWELGHRAGEWLLRLAREPSARVEVAFDYDTDFELLELAIRDAGLWDRVREVVTPINVGPLTGSPEGEIAAEGCFRELRRRGLSRHHALADANALRAAYIAVKAVARQMSQAVHSYAFSLLTQHAQELGLDEAWLHSWMRRPTVALGGRAPTEVLEEPDGLETLRDVLTRIAHGACS